MKEATRHTFKLLKFEGLKFEVLSKGNAINVFKLSNFQTLELANFQNFRLSKFEMLPEQNSENPFKL